MTQGLRPGLQSFVPPGLFVRLGRCRRACLRPLNFLDRINKIFWILLCCLV